MWPKAITQLIELAPHITRLIPMADRFLNSKTASEEASRNAMQQMSEGLRGDLGQVTAAHAGLYGQLTAQSQQLTAQSTQLSLIATELHATKLTLDSTETRIASLEAHLSKLWIVLSIALLFLVATCVLSILIFVHLR